MNKWDSLRGRLPRQCRPPWQRHGQRGGGADGCVVEGQKASSPGTKALDGVSPSIFSALFELGVIAVGWLLVNVPETWLWGRRTAASPPPPRRRKHSQHGLMHSRSHASHTPPPLKTNHTLYRGVVVVHRQQLQPLVSHGTSFYPSLTPPSLPHLCFAQHLHQPPTPRRP